MLDWILWCPAISRDRVVMGERPGLGRTPLILHGLRRQAPRPLPYRRPRCRRSRAARCDSLPWRSRARQLERVGAHSDVVARHSTGIAGTSGWELERVEARGEVLRSGRNLTFVRGLITGDGKACLNFSGTIMRRPLKKDQ